MRNFLKIAEGLDVGALKASLYRQPELWNQVAVRYTKDGPLSVHSKIDDIVLRYNPYRLGEDYYDKICSSIHVVTYPAWYCLPEAHPFIYATMGKVGGLHLGRVMISRLPPGGEIPVHSDLIPPAAELFPDRPEPARYYERYHIVIQSGPGVVFVCGEEQCYMAPGELWWFNNQLQHCVQNGSAIDRLHLVMDIRTQHDDYHPE